MDRHTTGARMRGTASRQAYSIGYSQTGAKIMRAVARMRQCWRTIQHTRDTEHRILMSVEEQEAWDDVKRLCREVK